ncbi:hypothetical protein G7Y89_g10712 [Cudoniella acicularis]|uniref:Heterokaryon incompatibility domain-containing protein n=1 Tax=Cudoniella acicularis TaxID=354080 RepID=A0A8H4RDB2_9HELO|nr:hypothetical protein G7Y89_g10712 [Cudoniella acicularis]
MSDPYIIDKLPERHIRLLDLHPGQPNSPFQGRLRQTCLDLPEFYEALSYTWGPPTTSSFLHCESGSIPLTLNLAQALSRLRNTDKIRTLWIDQICINQNDDAERGQQVSLMGDIYRGAALVDIWLGEEDTETILVMEYIPFILQSFSNSDERDEAGDEVPHVIQVLGILSLKSPKWIALRNLFGRPYFRRMWIVQEVALGKKSFVYCGSHSVSWKDLAKSALCLEEDAERHVEAHRVVRMIKELKRRDGYEYPGHRPFVNLLHQSFNLLCTNPRDKIYGVLGLASDIRPGELLPDYSLSCQKVYHAVTIFCIQKYSSLEVLCYVRNPKELSGLPSWVPDWTVMSKIRESLGFRSAEKYCAAGGKTLRPRFHISEDNHILYTNGKLVDRIRKTGPMLSNENRDIDNYEILLEWEKYAHAVSPYATGETYPTILWRTLIADDGTRGNDSDRARQQLYEAFQNLIIRNRGLKDPSVRDENWKPVEELSIVNSRNMEFNKLMEAASFGRRIAITEHGFLGLVPGDAQVDDEICIFETASVPFVLRRTQQLGYHKLVGECYLQGWMDGSRFQNWTSPDMFEVSSNISSLLLLRDCSGYPKLAQYLSRSSDTEQTGSTFNAFRECSTRNILYIEAEMLELIEQQNIFDRRDLTGDRQQAICTFMATSRPKSRSTTQAARQTHQKDKGAERISIIRLQKPPAEVVKGLKIWSEGGNRTDSLGAPQLAGNGRTRLGNPGDLVLLGTAPSSDWISREDGTLAEVSDRRIAQAANILYHLVETLMAGILFVGAIVNLYYVKGVGVKLGLVGVYTGLCTLTLGIMSSAGRAELFASTAA